jgi:RimJ/RimL family protein N-acetyltransferase
MVDEILTELVTARLYIKLLTLPQLNNPENYVYHSFWFIIRKEDKTVVGSMDFKNIPNKLKEIEIGYGLGKKL